jgi:hypothetical protein
MSRVIGAVPWVGTGTTLHFMANVCLWLVMFAMFGGLRLGMVGMTCMVMEFVCIHIYSWWNF